MSAIDPNTLTPEELTRFVFTMLFDGKPIPNDWAVALVAALNKYTNAV